MIPANTLWLAIAVIVAVYVIARWVRSKTVTEDEHPSDMEHYLIRSSGAGAAEHLGAKGSLTVSRYYFRQTSTETGPADPADFYDELFIDLRDDDSGQTWQNSIHVATPRALDRVMVEEHWDSVIGTELLIVRRYDLDTILHGAIDHLQEIYEAQVQLVGKGPSSEPVG
jgi:hypothetical protein